MNSYVNYTATGPLSLVHSCPVLYTFVFSGGVGKDVPSSLKVL